MRGFARSLATLTVAALATGAALADGNYFALTPSNPFSQNWSNAAMITTDDNWSGVPSVIGYRGDNLTAATGVDPQTVLGFGDNVVDVIANVATVGLTQGGVGEFDSLSNPTVALQGSGTADAPFLLFHLDTTNAAGITFSFNLRDIDNTADNAAQQVAVQYRIGNTGNFTNLPAGFVADATSGPNLGTLVTPVSVVLPALADYQPQVQVRVITTNAPGNDEWVGVDDIMAIATAPEPGTFALAGLGLVGLGAVARRRRK